MIALPPLIPTTQWTELSLAIARGNTDQVRRLVEENQIDINAFLDANNWMPLLMEALLSYGFESETDRLTLLRYLLEKGANPNQYSKKGYNCVHIAVQQERYWSALELFLDHGADVNAVDADGSTAAYWAIQVSLLRKGEDSDRAVSMRILKKILLLGPNLDQTNRFGMSARGWLEYAPDDLKSLIARWEAGKPAIRPAFTIQPAFPVNLQYPEVAQKIWSEVPASGPAPTVPGELLRSVEALREEAQRYGNAHYGRSHKKMAVFVRDTLVKSGFFGQPDVEKIRSGTEKLMRGRRPYKEDDVYDQLVDEVCVYYKSRETLISH